MGTHRVVLELLGPSSVVLVAPATELAIRSYGRPPNRVPLASDTLPDWIRTA
jgi:hypothetical protein